MRKTVKYLKSDDDFKKELDQALAEYLKSHKFKRKEAHQRVFLSLLTLLAVFAFYTYLITHSLNVFFVVIILSIIAILQIILLANFGHEYGHNAMSGSKGFNDFMFKLIFDSCGVDSFLWSHTHNLIHHPNPNIPNYDSDINGNSIFRMGPHEEYREIHKYQYIYAPFLYTLFFLNKFFVKDFKTIKKLKELSFLDEKSYPKAYRGLLIRKGAYLFLTLGLPYLIGNYSFLGIFLTFLCYHFLSSLCLGFLLGGSHSNTLIKIVHADKEGHMPSSYIKHQIETTVDFYATSKLWSILFGGTNSHVAHHLYPQVSAKHYVFISKKLETLSKKYGIEYNNLSLFAYVKEHWKYLKRLSDKHSIELQKQYKKDVL